MIEAAMTSNLTDRDYSIRITTDDLDEGCLKVESAIRVDKLYTFSKQIVNKKFGHLNREILGKVKNHLDILFSE